MSEEKKVQKPKSQNIIIHNRERISLSGVIDVESFNEDSIIVDTALGSLGINGQNLRINRFNIEDAELVVEGEFIGVEYFENSKSAQKSKSLLGKVFS